MMEDALVFVLGIFLGPVFDFVMIARKYGMRGWKMYRKKLRDKDDN